MPKKPNYEIMLEMIVGEEGKAKESKIGRTDSLLYRQYLSAFDILKKIVDNHYCYINNFKHSSTLNNYYNNVMVFNGARGRGKTSAMLTFRNTLADLTALYETRGPCNIEKGLHEIFCGMDGILEDKTRWIEGYRFIVLPEIDPVYLNNSHQLVEMFLAQLYQKAKEQMDGKEDFRTETPTLYRPLTVCPRNTREDYDRAVQRKMEFINLIEDCYSAVSALEAKEMGPWSLKNLEKLGAASSLKVLLRKAILSLLSMCGYDTANSFVIMQIDDADMSFGNIYNILEDMRCFLRIPNLIILMAADLSMIENTIQDNFTRKAKQAPESAAELTEQYMLKYFPVHMQIMLPDLKDLLQYNSQGIGLDAKIRGKEGRSLLQEITEYGNEEVLSIQESIRRMLFCRTGILLEAGTGHYSKGLPVSQRGIINFLSLLNRMNKIKRLIKIEKILENDQEAVAKEETEKEADESVGKLFFFHPTVLCDDSTEEYLKDLKLWTENVKMFSNYFTYEWALKALTDKELKLYRKIVREELSGKNAVAVQAINQLEGRRGQNTEKESQEQEGSEYYVVLSDNMKKFETRHPSSVFLFAVRVHISLASLEYALSELYKWYWKNSRNKSESGVVSIAELSDIHENCHFNILKKVYGNSLFQSSDKTFIYSFKRPENTEPLIKLFREREIEQQEKDDDNAQWEKRMWHALLWKENTGKPIYDLTAPLINSLYLDIQELYVELSNLDNGIRSTAAKKLRSLTDFSLLMVTSWEIRDRIIETLQKKTIIIDSSHYYGGEETKNAAEIAFDAYRSLYAKLADIICPEEERQIHLGLQLSEWMTKSVSEAASLLNEGNLDLEHVDISTFLVDTEK